LHFKRQQKKYRLNGGQASKDGHAKGKSGSEEKSKHGGNQMTSTW